MEPNFFDYTIPPGNECNIPSSIEAIEAYAAVGIYGSITLEMGCTLNGYRDLIWRMNSKHCSGFLSCFVSNSIYPLNICDPPIFFPPNKPFSRLGGIYITVENKSDRFIRKINIMGSESFSPVFRRYPDSCWHIIRIFIQDRYKQTLTYGWYEEVNHDNKIGCNQNVIHPIFLEDRQNLIMYDSYDLNVDFLNTGDSFVHKGQVWKICQEEPYGLFIKRTSLNLQINKNL